MRKKVKWVSQHSTIEYSLCKNPFQNLFLHDMHRKQILKLQEHLFIFLKGESGSPVAVRLEMRKIYLLACIVLGIFFCFFSGTVLFFRELEMNRKLQNKLLLLDTKEKMSLSFSQTQAQAQEQVNPIVQGLTPPIETKITETTDPITAHLNDFTINWNGEVCTAHISMIPTSTGTAKGSLLLLLETEVPRIGEVNPTGQIRKRYFTYPGYQSRDKIDESLISQIERKPFHFSRALQTGATFKIGKLLRPIALNIYLFDSKESLIYHDRKPIETDTDYAH